MAGGAALVLPLSERPRGLSRWVAKLCRRVWVVTCFSIPAASRLEKRP